MVRVYQVREFMPGDLRRAGVLELYLGEFANVDAAYAALGAAFVAGFCDVTSASNP